MAGTKKRKPKFSCGEEVYLRGKKVVVVKVETRKFSEGIRYWYRVANPGGRMRQGVLGMELRRQEEELACRLMEE